MKNTMKNMIQKTIKEYDYNKKMTREQEIKEWKYIKEFGKCPKCNSKLHLKHSGNFIFDNEKTTFKCHKCKYFDIIYCHIYPNWYLETNQKITNNEINNNLLKYASISFFILFLIMILPVIFIR